METAGRRTVVSNDRSIAEESLVSNSLRFGMIALLSLGAFFCARPISSSASPTDTLQAAAKPEAAPIQKLELKYDKPVVGAKVRATVAGLPPGKTVDLQWGTVTGGWVIENYYFFRGMKYSPASLSLGKFPVDASGRLDATFAIPEDYGGVHDVIATIDGQTVAQNGMEVTQSFEMTPLVWPCRNAGRIARQRTGLANDGKYLGRQLG